MDFWRGMAGLKLLSGKVPVIVVLGLVAPGQEVACQHLPARRFGFGVKAKASTLIKAYNCNGNWTT